MTTVALMTLVVELAFTSLMLSLETARWHRVGEVERSAALAVTARMTAWLAARVSAAAALSHALAVRS